MLQEERLIRARLRAHLRLEQDLRVTVRAGVELLVSVGRIFERQTMTDDKARFCKSGDDQIAQPFVVTFGRRLPHLDADALIPGLPERQRVVPVFLLRVRRARIFGKIHADDRRGRLDS